MRHWEMRRWETRRRWEMRRWEMLRGGWRVVRGWAQPPTALEGVQGPSVTAKAAADPGLSPAGAGSGHPPKDIPRRAQAAGGERSLRCPRERGVNAEGGGAPTRGWVS